MERTWLKRALLAAAILLAAACLVVLALPNEQSNDQLQGENPPQSSQQPTDPQLPQQPELPETPAEEIPQPDHDARYEMGIWEGKVAVFVPGTNHPMRITEMPVSSLPEADQQALEKRIPVYDVQQLAGFLEDYGS